MSKPEEISDHIWSVAMEAYEATIQDFSKFQGSCTAIAHAIARCVENEREECARLAENTPRPYKHEARMISKEQADHIALAIRARSLFNGADHGVL